MFTKSRLENLADGTFAIILTLLVLDLKIPDNATNHKELVTSLLENKDVFIAYLLVAITLTSYWLSHHHILSLFANKIDQNIAIMNIVFLTFLSILPFSANLLGKYSVDPMSFLIYGINVLCIFVTLLMMKYAVLKHPENRNDSISKKERRNDTIIRWITIIFIILGIIIAKPGHTNIAIFLFVFPSIMIFLPRTTSLIDKYIVSKIRKF
ncbi:MAG: TMEM175 family protein [Candidatus Gracilibacteria bacterium]|nr:TMEM175 family protein [Candidatus Gracilibacteria bacterium]